MGFSPSIYCIFDLVNYLFYLTQLPPNSPVLSVRLPQVTLVLRWEDSNHSDRCTCSHGKLPGSALQPVEHVMALCCSSWSSSPSGTSGSGTSLSKHGHSDRSQCYINWGKGREAFREGICKRISPFLHLHGCAGHSP